MTNLRIRLFGGLLLESSGRVLPRIPSRVGRSLFAFLVMNRDRELSRDLLAGTFWPDMPDSQARRRLSQSLWQIQTHLMEAGVKGDFILANAHGVRFNRASSYWLDVEAFETGLRAIKDNTADVGDLAATADLYRGDLLSGFYDEWFLLDQARLRDEYLDLLGSISTAHKSRGRFDDALIFARRLALNDPLREEAHREVMRLCYLAGRPNDALLQYEICYATLQDELGTEPTAETTALFESIAAEREAGSVPFRPAASSPLLDNDMQIPLVGRRDERAVGLSIIEGALTSQGGMLLVEGAAGVGKSRFLDALIDDANWRGIGVLRGDAGLTRESYAPISAALEQSLTRLRVDQLGAQIEPVWLRKVANLTPQINEWIPDLPPSAALRPSEESHRMLEAIAHVFVGLSNISPLLLVLDDFDAADDDTVRAIRHLSNIVDGSRLVIALSYHKDVAAERDIIWDCLREIDRLPNTRRVDLKPLSEPETVELIRLSTASDMDPGRSALLHAETGGNPLFLLETLRAQHEHQVAAATAGTTVLTDRFPLPDSVQDAIGARIAALSASQIELLRWLAVAGIEAEAEVLLAANPRPRPEFFFDLDALVQRGIIANREGRYRFVHQQVQRVVDLGLDDRVAFHRAIANSLEALHPEWPESIAHHYAAAGNGRSAAMYAEQAAARAINVKAYANAAQFYAMALESADDGSLDNATRFRLLSGLEQSLDVLGDRAGQAEALKAMSDTGSGTNSERSETLRRIAWLQAHTDRFEEAIVTAGQALQIDLERGDEASMAHDFRALGMISLWSGNASQAISHLEQATSLARGEQLAEATEALARALTAAQRYDEASRQAETALRLFVAADNRRGQAEALGSLGVITMERGEAEAALDFYQRAIHVCRAIGYQHGEGVNLVNHANALWYTGRAAEALDQFEEAIAVFRALSNRRGEAVARANAAALHHTIGDNKTAQAYSEQSFSYFAEVQNDVGLAQVLCNLADIARTQGRFDESRTHLTTALAGTRASENHWLEIQALHALALVELESGNHGHAIGVADEALGVSRTYGFGDFAPNLLSIRGMAQLAQGDLNSALASTSEAIKLLHPGSNRAYLIPHRHAVVLEACGRSDEAALFAAEAASMLDQALAGLPEDKLEAVRSVPEHSKIQTGTAKTVEARMVREGVPTGRHLTDDDYVPVRLTIHQPSDLQIADPATRRGQQIIRLVSEAREQGAVPTVDDLASHLSTSVRTVRRTIAGLRTAGTEITTRGSKRSPGRKN